MVGADSFVEILGNPFGTTSQLVDQFTSNVERTFEEINTLGTSGDVQATGSHKSARLIPADPIVAAHKRNIAAQLGLDPYSSNPRVHDFLNTLAHARASGRSSAGTVSISLPRGIETPVRGGRVQAEIRSLLARNTLAELATANGQTLGGMSIDANLVSAFLAHPHFSPSHRTSITQHLATLTSVANRGALLKAALRAKSETDALG